MASDMQISSSLPDPQVQREQFIADEKENHQQTKQSVSMGVKQHRVLVSIENILPQPAMVTTEIVEPPRPGPTVGNQSVMKVVGERRPRGQKRPVESSAIAGTEGSKKRLKRL